MKRALAALCISLLPTLTLGAQGRGHGSNPKGQAPVTSPGSKHSNAPTGTPATSADRDFGRDRAEDVGRGKKKGLHKTKHKHTKGEETKKAKKVRAVRGFPSSPRLNRSRNA